MTDYAIEIKNLIKEFDDFTLGPIDLNIAKWSIVGFIGQNGAGKTTTIKLLLGLLNKDSGEIKVLGASDTKDIKVKDRIGVVFDDLYIPEEMNLIDVEKFSARVYSKWDEEKFNKLVKDFKLPEKKLVKNYSRGMKMKLSMAMALSHNAELLILDEATSGLDPVARVEVLDLLLDFIQEENNTVFISSHILSDLEKIADYIAFIYDGKILFFDSKENLEEKYAITSVSDSEAINIPNDAIIGKRVHSFGQELLVKREKVLDDLNIANFKRYCSREKVFIINYINFYRNLHLWNIWKSYFMIPAICGIIPMMISNASYGYDIRARFE